VVVLTKCSLFVLIRGDAERATISAALEGRGARGNALVHIPGSIGDCIRNNKEKMRLELREDTWDWPTYLTHVDRMRVTYEKVISEYNGNRKNTVGLNDLSIIALGKTLKLPVISSEKKLATAQDSERRQKIPDICDLEGVAHMSFNEFLRKEGIKN
jgi:hypothetical protein